MKKIKNWYKKRNEQGSSLLEVIVAVVILAVVGSTLLGGLNSANLAQRKTAQVAFAENQMQMGNDALALTDFVACDSTLTNPYTGVSLPNNVTILSVGVFDPNTSAVTACSSITTAAAKTAETVEQIKIQYTNGVTGITRTRTVLKYLQTLTTNLSTDCKAAGYSVNTISPSTMQLVAGDWTIGSNALSTTCDSYGTDTVWDATTITGLNGATGLAAYVDSQSLLNFSSASTGTAGTITVRVNAHDSLTGTAAIYKSMTVTLLPTISLNTGSSSSTSTWTVLQGCGVMSTQSIKCTTTSTRQFVLTGGSRSSASTWQPNVASSTMPWNLTVSGKTSTLSYDYTNNTAAGTYTLPFTATGGALLHDMNFGSINLVVRPQLSFGTGIVTATSSNCSNKAFKSTTSSSKCSISVSSVPGYGFVDSNSNGAVTFTSDTRYVSNTSTSTSVSYSSTTDNYSKSISFWYKGSTATGALCVGAASGTTAQAIIGYMKDVLTGTIFPITVQVTC